MNDIQPAPSLVKYSNPILISNSQKKQIKQQPPSNTEDILNAILLPREFNHQKNQLQMQCVSPAPSTKQDVLELQDKLDKWLQQRQARETGLCPIREELYSQCFDELIRQITINCAERGMLLVTVRNEVRMVIQTYQTLYASSIAFGMRKFLSEEEKKAEYRLRIKQLEQECSELHRQVESLEQKLLDTKQQDEIKRQQTKEAHADIVSQLKADIKAKVNGDLEKILTGQKKLPDKK
ncbi:unnamed protein product [Paramecium primaurelia]|uniref:Uncharacterized protein n=2 Tax=Paramecium TaxID=5884 RepID=A0A8S1SEW2_9CILI|nr:unnamed protein product [Paramecium primaurelia]CAD8138350.1 unnamed protein product [Paramecium pentaurelia]